MEKEEITKEIKNINEIDTTPKEKEEDEPEEKEITTKPPEKNPNKTKKSNKKKTWIMIGIVGCILLITIIVVVLLVNNNTDDSAKKTTKSNESKFVSLLNESLKSGEFDREIREGLSENDVDVDSVCLLRMDLDSDGNYGIVAYAEGTKKILLQINTTGIVSYEDSFQLDSKESLGYTYSSEKNENYWFTSFEKNYTVISSAKKIIKEEDFLNTYFVLTNTYQQKSIINHCIDYSFNQALDTKKLEKNIIKPKELLKDNGIKQEDIKELYTKYITEKKEKEQKEKEEAEKKAKEEELKVKVSGTFSLGSVSYQYGSYQIKTAENEEDGMMVLYSDGTCTYKDAACKFQIGEVRNEEDELVPGITLNNGKTFISSSEEKTLLEPKDKITAVYHG